MLKLVCSIIVSVTIFLLDGCSFENKQVSQPESEMPKTLAVPPQIKIVETPRFKELKKQFNDAESEVKLLEEQRIRLLVVYTEEHPKVKKVSRDLAKAGEKLKIVESLLNEECEKVEYRIKNPPV